MLRSLSSRPSRHIWAMYQGVLNPLDTQRVNYNLVATRELSQNLPRLPVPKLEDTLKKYVKSVQPFLTKDELAKTCELISKFGNQNGNKLQEHLITKAANSENWLLDWWLNTAYLGFRSSVVVWSSPGLVFPFQKFTSEKDRIVYAAKLILAAVDYKLQIDDDKIPVDMMGKDPLDMNQYKRVYGTCRVPGLPLDSLEFNPCSKHIIVVCNNHFFKVDVLNDKRLVASKRQLVCILNDIVELSACDTAPIGVLTSEHRDNWAKAYQHLVKDCENESSLKDIQSSLFLVCLDDCMPDYNNKVNAQTLASHQFIHGGGSKYNSGNRWYDKTIQFIIGKDGGVGLTYEHSPSEGQPIAVLTDYLMNYIKSDKCTNIPDADNIKSQRLKFNVDETTQGLIDCAKTNIDKLVSDLELSSFTFKPFGKEFIKTQKLSPDSFIQMALQLAFYRLHKVPGAHYESAATRKYLHGRTETIRSCSVESVAFARAMLNNSCNEEDKVRLLREAVNAHKKYTAEAVNGFGVDRHLLGLKLMALEKKLELPELYKDKSYAVSSHMRLSTSQVATLCDGFMCFGPLVMDGYACCYNPRKDDMNFAVSAMISDPETSAKKFHEALEHSLMDMHDLLLKTQKHKL